MARWDSPLFTVPYDDETPPFDAIWEAMVGSEGKAKAVKPNQATVLVCIHLHFPIPFPFFPLCHIYSFSPIPLRSKGTTNNVRLPLRTRQIHARDPERDSRMAEGSPWRRGRRDCRVGAEDRVARFSGFVAAAAACEEAIHRTEQTA